MSLISVEQFGPQVRMTINRPEKANAMTTAMTRSLVDALRDLDGSPEERIFVLAGSGNQCFCSGSDVDEFGHGDEHLAEAGAATAELVTAMLNLRAPTIALVQGAARGLGALIPALSDVVLARDDLAFSFPEVHFGIYPTMIHVGLAERLSPRLAWQLCASGRVVGASEAQTLGLVTEIMPTAGYAARAAERIGTYIANRQALGFGREISMKQGDQPLASRLEHARRLMLVNSSLPGVAERVRAYLSHVRGRAAKFGVKAEES